MIQSGPFFLAELRVIHSYDGMILFMHFVERHGRSIMVRIGSIFCVEYEMRFMRINIFYIYCASVCVSPVAVVIVIGMLVASSLSSCFLYVALFSQNPFAVANPCRFER